MNIEELELSLRIEIESQVRSVLAGIKTEVSEFQDRFQSEFEEHRAKLDATITELSSRLPESVEFDAAFTESVNEHLRLARDDGASVAAVAFGEAEKLRAETEVKTVLGGFDLMRDAINEISSKNTQATILQALVDQASQFAARGAFFIVKNDRFVGWKVFGADAPEHNGEVRDIMFSASSDTVLAAAVRSMAAASAQDGEHSEDSLFLDPIGFGRPSHLHAIPLIARGRGVAVLYADRGNDGDLNVEALETLVRVAALTVELLAASHAAPAHQPVVQEAPAQAEVEEAVAAEAEDQVSSDVEHEEVSPEAGEAPASTYEVTEVESVSEIAETAVESEEDVSVEEEVVQEPVAETEEAVEEYTGEVTYELEYASSPDAEAGQTETLAAEEPAANGFEFSSGAEYDASGASDQEPEPEPEYEETSVPAVEAPVAASLNGNAEVATVAEPVVEVASAEPKKSRFSDRNVDLPIEVPDSERRLHNDARRFARLLVSEIKLYNEQQVSEGREAGDLYDRLREAIDRSREMYDKRVQPAVASKYDYFHYEVVNNLAEGQDAKLGSNYPGATV
ncbi:MAG TPA: hypothetical protein VFZ49_09980 [Pyrinomonadaceae bacterium]